MAQAKMQAYMDRHKLGPLFEDLMNRVLRDLPEEPLIYLLRSLYKKVGMDIPQEIRYGGMRKSVDLVRSRSPERPSRGSHSQGITDPNSTSASREYEKPWLHPPSRSKHRRSAQDADASAKSGKKRPDWQGDTKVMATSFDELWDEQQDGHKRDASPGKRSRSQNDPRSSWAAVGLESGDTFTSGEYRGPSHQARVNDEELLADEIVRTSGRDLESSQPSTQQQSASGVRGQRLDYERHRRDLETMLHPKDSSNSRETQYSTHDSDMEDEAIELLENADDLKQEGVTNIPASGYKLSKMMRQRSNEPCVKLNINLSPRSLGALRNVDSLQSFEGYESDQENASPTGGRWETDDEFESVSQVTGPRRPVWQVPDSDGEIVALRSSQKHSRKHHQAKQDLSASAPEPFQQVTFETGDLDLTPNQTWSPAHNIKTEDSSPERDQETDVISRQSGGWVVPDDSDAASVQDWNQRVKGRKRDPRAY